MEVIRIDLKIIFCLSFLRIDGINDSHDEKQAVVNDEWLVNDEISNTICQYTSALTLKPQSLMDILDWIRSRISQYFRLYSKQIKRQYFIQTGRIDFANSADSLYFHQII